LKREKDELAVVNQSIEARLSEALHKVDQIAIMEMDKKRMQDREIIPNQEIERAKKEIENFREERKEFIKKIEEAEIN
jgi:glutamyl-tRNA reductase